VPRPAALALAYLGRSYIRHCPCDFGKGAILNGRFLFRLCDWHRIAAVTITDLDVRYSVQFPDYLQKHILYFGVWEPVITAFVAATLRGGDRFVDVGANIGYYTYLAARLVGPAGSVYAIEASPSIYRTLVHNLRINGFGNVHNYNTVVADRHGTAPVFKALEWNLGKTCVISGAPGEQAEAEIAARPLHEIVSWDVLRDVRLIKVDVEGAEWLVVNGIRDRLPCFAHDTEWLIEISPAKMLRLGTRPDDLIGLFAQAGYDMYVLENRYDAAWYLRQRRRVRGRAAGDLLDVARLAGQAQIDALFTRRSYALRPAPQR
jgi:FkbM family methyltransferase